MSFRLKQDAVIAGVAVILLASVGTIAAAHAEALENAVEAKKAEAVVVKPPVVVAPQKVKKLQEVSKAEKYAATREQLSAVELKEVLALAGFEGKALKQAWAVVMKESTGRPTAHNGNSNTGDNSYGLFQINMIGGLGEDRRNKYDLKQNEDLFNPVTNAKIAYKMSQGGADWGAWGIGANAYNGGKAGSFYEWLAKYPD